MTSAQFSQPGIWKTFLLRVLCTTDVLDSVPPNVRFEVDDVEAEWTYSAPFDYIHCRYMVASIFDWPRFLRQTYR